MDTCDVVMVAIFDLNWICFLLVTPVFACSGHKRSPLLSWSCRDIKVCLVPLFIDLDTLQCCCVHDSSLRECGKSGDILIEPFLLPLGFMCYTCCCWMLQVRYDNLLGNEQTRSQFVQSSALTSLDSQRQLGQSNQDCFASRLFSSHDIPPLSVFHMAR